MLIRIWHQPSITSMQIYWLHFRNWEGSIITSMHANWEISGSNLGQLKISRACLSFSHLSWFPPTVFELGNQIMKNKNNSCCVWDEWRLKFANSISELVVNETFACLLSIIIMPKVSWSQEAYSSLLVLITRFETYKRKSAAKK